MVAPGQIGGVYARQVTANPAAISAMQKQIKQKELQHQQQQEKMKKEFLFQEQKQRLKTMTGSRTVLGCFVENGLFVIVCTRF